MYFTAFKQEDRYGYDIIKILQGLFPDTDESTIYAILRRLNKGGLTEVYYSEKSLGPQRKYYKIVEKGELYLKENIAYTGVGARSEIDRPAARHSINIRQPCPAIAGPPMMNSRGMNTSVPRIGPFIHTALSGKCRRPMATPG